jgi:hypothetical protein
VPGHLLFLKRELLLSIAARTSFTLALERMFHFLLSRSELGLATHAFRAANSDKFPLLPRLAEQIGVAFLEWVNTKLCCA